MANRITFANADSVRALNLIDVEFPTSSSEDAEVRAAWSALLEHLNVPRPQDQAGGQAWDEQNKDFLAELLSKMGRPLGYDFTFTYYKAHAYYPSGHNEESIDSYLIRKGWLEVVKGDRALKMEITKVPDIRT